MRQASWQAAGGIKGPLAAQEPHALAPMCAHQRVRALEQHQGLGAVHGRRGSGRTSEPAACPPSHSMRKTPLWLHSRCKSRGMQPHTRTACIGTGRAVPEPVAGHSALESSLPNTSVLAAEQVKASSVHSHSVAGSKANVHTVDIRVPRRLGAML